MFKTESEIRQEAREEDVRASERELLNFEPIKGFPSLHWRGKRPFVSTQFYPAQIKERFGKADEVSGWSNKVYWGDNFQVMSHLLRQYRGQVKLAYIDPPYDSKADYSKTIQLKGTRISSSTGVFEEKQYTDIWTNDSYLQFMFDRLLLIRELLSDDGSIWVHCDWHKSHQIRCILDEIFGATNLQNEVIWQRTDPHNDAKSRLGWVHDTIYWYAKNRQSAIYNWSDVATSLSQGALDEYSLARLPDGSTVKSNDIQASQGRRFKLDDCTYKGTDPSRRFVWRGARPSPKRVWPYKTSEEMDAAVEKGEFFLRNPQVGAARCRVSFLDEREGQVLQTIWTDTGRMKGGVDYPTQKPVPLLERIIKASSNPGDIVLDTFMGSGSTQVAALRTGRKFLGADINIGAVHLAIRRLLQETQALKAKSVEESNNMLEVNAGLELYNVNHYDLFGNPIEAKQLLLEALEVNPLPRGHLFDGEKDGRMVKVMPVNRIATRADLNDIIANLDYRALDRRQVENPHQPVERITLVCMGHEADLAAQLKTQMHPYTLDVQVVDILRDKQDLVFKRDSEAKITQGNGTMTIERFYPMNLLQKLSLETEKVEDWRELVESVMIDFNYGGGALEPSVIDIPEKNELVKGSYPIPDDAGTIRVKITDVLSESLEVTLQDGE